MNSKLLSRGIAIIALCVSVLTLPAQGAEHSGLTVEQLRCEQAEDPMGVDTAQPRLYWKVEGRARGQRQTAYQILVASTEALLAKDQGDLWNSGKVLSDETIHVRYGGKEPRSSQQVFWKVRVWDKDDRGSAWSQPANWTMGLMIQEEPGERSRYSGAGWEGQWICAPAETEALLMRKEFTVKPGLVRAIAHVVGLGQYEMSLNGVKAGDDLLSPGWTDYDRTVLYDTRDITSLLRKGSNAVGLVLGNGIYNVVRRNRFVKFTGYYGPLRAICQIELEYADGTREIVGTDETWRTTSGPIVFSNIYSGEDHDARLYPTGWDKPGFDDSVWKAVVRVIRPTGKLRGMTMAAPPLKEIEVRKTVAVRQLADPNTATYDLGQNTSYMPRLRVSGPKGSTVRLTPGEILNDDGTVNRGTMGGTGRGLSWWEYTKGTDGVETWMPKFCYIGCRYLQALRTPAKPGGKLPKIESVEGVIVHSTAAPIGDFQCSNDLLNRIRILVRWAQRANMVSLLTDCPHREKLGWLEQDHLNGPSIRYEYDVSRIFTKTAHDMSEAQLHDGMVPNIAPEYRKAEGAFRNAAEWGASFILVPWQQYQFDGDTDLLREYYEPMKRYFAFLESRTKNDILSDGLGDWFDLGPRKPGRAQLTPPPVTATAFYFHNAWVLSHIANVLQKYDDAKVYADKAERIRRNYNAHFFNATTMDYATGSQCANALPLVLGIVDPENREAVLASLVRNLESGDYAVTAGEIGFRFVLQALAQGGRSDVIYKMINQEDKPGYGYMLKQGETSLTESWDANRTTSHNHFMLGQITEWFYKDLVGIEADLAGPGFKKILIHPDPVGDLKWARASYDSIRGKITCHWKHEDGKFTLHVVIPANTTATVSIPTKSARDVTEGGRPAANSPGVNYLHQKGNRAMYVVESGEYSFESRF